MMEAQRAAAPQKAAVLPSRHMPEEWAEIRGAQQASPWQQQLTTSGTSAASYTPTVVSNYTTAQNFSAASLLNR
jgi:hypothetical protein